MKKIVRVAKESVRMIRSNKLRVFIMMLGMAVGIAALTIMVCVSRGVYEEVMDTVNQQGPDLLQVRPGTDVYASSTEVVSLVTEDADAIQQNVGNIVAIAPVKDRKEIEVEYEDKFTFTRIFGIIPIWAEIRDFDAIRGEFISEEDVAFSARVCVIGQVVKDNLFGDADPIGQTIQINDVPFTVKGELQPKGIGAEGRERDNRIVVPITTYTSRLFRDISLTQIVITVRDVALMDKTVEDVAAVLRERHRIAPGESDDFAMRTPQDLIDIAYSTSRSLLNLLTGIAIVTLLVAGVVIMNIMLAVVSARRSEIGIRRALGARKNDILRQFLIECLLISLMGGALGVLLGYGGSLIISSFGITDSKVTILALAAAIVFCSLIAIVFGLYPSRKAAVQNPVDALRV